MKVLVVIDMQYDFVTGPLGTPEARIIVPTIMEKIIQYNKGINLVLFTKDTHYEDTYLDSLEGQKLPIKHCIDKTPGWRIIKPLSSLVCESNPDSVLLYDSEYKINMNRIRKNTFGSDDLVNFIKHENDIIDEVELCGVCTDICVISNALAIRQALPNMRIIVDAEACAGTTPENHEAALKVMESCQIDIIRGK